MNTYFNLVCRVMLIANFYQIDKWFYMILFVFAMQYDNGQTSKVYLNWRRWHKKQEVTLSGRAILLIYHHCSIFDILKKWHQIPTCLCFLWYLIRWMVRNRIWNNHLPGRLRFGYHNNRMIRELLGLLVLHQMLKLVFIVDFFFYQRHLYSKYFLDYIII